MIIKQIITIVLLILCIYYFNDIKYILQVRYFTKKHARKKRND
jgi:hypothetical protein